MLLSDKIIYSLIFLLITNSFEIALTKSVPCYFENLVYCHNYNIIPTYLNLSKSRRFYPLLKTSCKHRYSNLENLSSLNIFYPQKNQVLVISPCEMIDILIADAQCDESLIVQVKIHCSSGYFEILNLLTNNFYYYAIPADFFGTCSFNILHFKDYSDGLLLPPPAYFSLKYQLSFVNPPKVIESGHKFDVFIRTSNKISFLAPQNIELSLYCDEIRIQKWTEISLNQINQIQIISSSPKNLTCTLRTEADNNIFEQAIAKNIILQNNAYDKKNS